MLAQVKQGQQRAGDLKRGLTAEQKAFFQDHRLDGKGKTMIFVTTWQGLQLVLSKTRDVCEFLFLSLTAALFPATVSLACYTVSPFHPFTP